MAYRGDGRRDSGQHADTVIDRLVRWAERQDAVRTILLTSTRAIPGAHVDALSDYDVMLVARDIHPFVVDRSWIGDFGEVLVAYWDSVAPYAITGIEQVGNIAQYVAWTSWFLYPNDANPSVAKASSIRIMRLPVRGNVIPPANTG